ncbi:hypothetical protein GCM10025865_11890 [Paraoerskovia sediminicola]|uniref:HTH lysR-type domain-containing protein n=1 Tax=Paraoerskovia sediminicola TaxID=1138587 RepID=A0ABM8G1R2_9CELL|nr:hypothetical protein GCM10025865_11890 [Paraoerskovia sediminicola]
MSDAAAPHPGPVRDWDLAQLRALAAAADLGTLDAAARALHVTPSAVSQRIKALEHATGAVLLRRERPVRPTAAGEALVLLARQIDALTSDASRGLGAAGLPTVRIAVNGDSLATWVLPALAALAATASVRISREDQDRSAELLRDGEVMAAITSQARSVQGCTVEPLGVMRYRPMASPGFRDRWFSSGGPRADALSAAPVVVFDADDRLQDRYLTTHGVDPHDPPRHLVPASAEFVTAVRLGYGWGMLPDLQVTDDVAAGRVVPIDEGPTQGRPTSRCSGSSGRCAPRPSTPQLRRCAPGLAARSSPGVTGPAVTCHRAPACYVRPMPRSHAAVPGRSR